MSDTPAPSVPTSLSAEALHTPRTHDVFISHAHEDKVEVARPLARYLERLGFRVWLDEAEITVGDSLRTVIDRGLQNSRFGVVILSPSFFKKNWTQYELDGLIAKSEGSAKVILPVWHRITREDVASFSLGLAGRLGVSTDLGIKEVAHRISRAILRESMPTKPAVLRPPWRQGFRSVDLHRLAAAMMAILAIIGLAVAASKMYLWRLSLPDEVGILQLIARSNERTTNNQQTENTLPVDPPQTGFAPVNPRTEPDTPSQIDSTLSGQVPSLEIRPVVTQTSCGRENGSAMVEVDNAVLPISYRWSMGATTQKVTNLPSGKYSVIVSDAAGRVATKEILILSAPPLTATMVTSPATGPDRQDGSASIRAHGGTPPYIYQWPGGISTPHSTIQGLGPGSYSVTLRDSMGCETSAPFQVATAR